MISQKTRIALALSALPLLVAGCGGGSSATGGQPSVPGVPTTSKLFPLASNKTTKLTGRSREYSAKLVNGQIVATKPTQTANADISATTDANGRLKSATLKSPRTTISGSSVEEQDDRISIVLRSPDQQQALGFVDPERSGFSYQTYGGWEDGAPTDGRVGMFSVGHETAGADLPKSGTAKFTGHSEAMHTDGTDTPELVGSTVTLDADFAKRSVSYKSTTEFPGRSYLNMNGRMTYAAGSNAMKGTFTTAGGYGKAPISGTIDGRFYGNGKDAAKEVGGTFGAQNAQQTFVGAYGAKR